MFAIQIWKKKILRTLHNMLQTKELQLILKASEASRIKQDSLLPWPQRDPSTRRMWSCWRGHRGGYEDAQRLSHSMICIFGYQEC